MSFLHLTSGEDDFFVSKPLEFDRFKVVEFDPFEIRVQSYCFFLNYANFLLFFYIIVGTIVVVGVDIVFIYNSYR